MEPLPNRPLAVVLVANLQSVGVFRIEREVATGLEPVLRLVVHDVGDHLAGFGTAAKDQMFELAGSSCLRFHSEKHVEFSWLGWVELRLAILIRAREKANNIAGPW
jgi:hypothetical protein